QDMIDALISCIKEEDPVKARGALSLFHKTDDKSRRRILFELSRAEAAFSVPLLASLLAAREKPREETPVIKEMLISHLLERPDLLLEGMRGDADPGEKAIYFQLAGGIRPEGAAPALMEILSDADDPKTINLAITALGALGDSAAVGVLADHLYSDERSLVASAVQALGKIGSPAAIHRLAERMGADYELDRMILDIFSDVQNAASLQKLNNAIRSRDAHVRALAKEALAGLGGKSISLLTENLLEDDPDTLIHSLNLLGEIGDMSVVSAIRRLLDSIPKNPNVRFAAYEALGRLPLIHGAFSLAGGLLDPEEHVCIAAAKAVDLNFNDILKVGIKNMVRIGDDDSRKIVKTIIHARADAIFLGLAPEAYFQDLALERLPRVHVDIQRHFKELLEKNGFDEFAGKITPGKGKTPRGATVCAVDDSRMVLEIYKNTLHELGCDAVLFEFPGAAIQWLEKEKADILFVDLNMPKITGVQLAEKIREKYSKEELPIIMVTSQNETHDHHAAYKAGVNDIIYKPFTAETLKRALDTYC
ncbi:MAG: response regulator, partial [Desulfobacterales bacterium]|nr:response regulator [Desulfobacterales bacterium]